MGVTVRRPSGRPDTWGVLAGETRWVDYSCEQVGADLVVFEHSFRRIRERTATGGRVLLWKPSTTRIARRYAEGEWSGVADQRREWPPTGLVPLPGRDRTTTAER